MTAAYLGAELQRTIRLARSYWLEYVADFVLYALGFLFLIQVFQAAAPEYGPSGYLSTLIGYLTWKICASVLVEVAQTAGEEARTGTLEQLFLGCYQPFLLMLGRGVSSTLNHGLRGALLGLVLAAMLGVLQPVPFSATILFLLTLAGAFGLGVGLAGLALVYKRVSGMLQIIWQMLVFFTGALAPLEGPLFGSISRLLPLSWGIAGLRALLVNGATFVDLWASGLFIGLVLNTLVYLLLGIGLFAWGSHRARRLGVLAHY